MNELERAAHRAWLANAAYAKFGRCDSCDRLTDEEGHPLYVARQENARKFECLACWDLSSTAAGARVQGAAR